MTDYTKSTNFATKDALLSGNPLKIVKGTEIDTEFNNIATSISTKADTSAVASSILAAMEAIYPVGSVYINATDNTDPSVLFGFGSWVAFGAGRVPVGFDNSDSNFNAAGKTGGSKDAITVSHTHTVTDSGHIHGTAGSNQVGSATGAFAPGTYPLTVMGNPANMASATTGISIDSAGSSGTNANLQPFVTVYMWKRTA